MNTKKMRDKTLSGLMADSENSESNRTPAAMPAIRLITYVGSNWKFIAISRVYSLLAFRI
jgi:hypothetical protein